MGTNGRGWGWVGVPGPFTAEDLSRLAQVPASEIEALRLAGLLDPDGDGVFDDYDLVRLEYLLILRAEGHTDEEIARGLREGTIEVPFFGDVLFGPGRLFAGGSPRYTVEEAAEWVGLTLEQIEALRVAPGLPGMWIEERDLEMMAGVKAVMDAGIPWEAILDVTRVYGDSLRRIAEAEMRMMHAHVHERLAAEGVPHREIARQTHALMQALTAIVDPAVQYLHHQHLLRFVMQDVLAHLQAPERSRGRSRRRSCSST